VDVPTRGAHVSVAEETLCSHVVAGGREHGRPEDGASAWPAVARHVRLIAPEPFAAAVPLGCGIGMAASSRARRWPATPGADRPIRRQWGRAASRAPSVANREVRIAGTSGVGPRERARLREPQAGPHAEQRDDAGGRVVVGRCALGVVLSASHVHSRRHANLTGAFAAIRCIIAATAVPGMR
jgi:hypothetical protein